MCYSIFLIDFLCFFSSDSGYPIVTHMDVSEPKSKDFLFNSEQLETKGAWGLFHELGHNMQQGWWSKY